MLTKVISQERERQEKTLREVAKLSKLSKQAVHNVETGKSSFIAALRVAKALGIRGKRLFELAKFEAVRMARAA